MLFEAVTFVAASLVHVGVAVTGYEHREAAQEPPTYHNYEVAHATT